MRIAQRIGSWRAPFVFGAYALSLPAYALVLTDAQAASPLLAAGGGALVYRLAVIGLAGMRGCMVIDARESAFRYLLGAQLLRDAVPDSLLSAARGDGGPAHARQNVLWAFLYEPYPTGIVLSCAAAVALPAARLLAQGYGVLTAAAVVMAAGAVGDAGLCS